MKALSSIHRNAANKQTNQHIYPFPGMYGLQRALKSQSEANTTAGSIGKARGHAKLGVLRTKDQVLFHACISARAQSKPMGANNPHSFMT